MLVSAGHSSVRFGGQTRLGGSVSLTVMVWTQIVALPQPSVAVHMREITFVPPGPFVTESPKLTVTKPQSSCAVATPVAFVVVFAGHCNVTLVGQTKLGGFVSFTKTFVEHVLEQVLLVTVRVAVKLSAQFVPGVTLTVCAFVAPEIEPLPVTDQE